MTSNFKCVDTPCFECTFGFQGCGSGLNHSMEMQLHIRIDKDTMSFLSHLSRNHIYMWCLGLDCQESQNARVTNATHVQSADWLNGVTFTLNICYLDLCFAAESHSFSEHSLVTIHWQTPLHVN